MKFNQKKDSVVDLHTGRFGSSIFLASTPCFLVVCFSTYLCVTVALAVRLEAATYGDASLRNVLVVSLIGVEGLCALSIILLLSLLGARAHSFQWD
jgi:hypothetical protein